MAHRMNDSFVAPQMREALARYTGKFIPSIASVEDWSIVLNEIYPVVQFNLPAIFFRNPRVFLKPRNKFFIAKRRDPISGKLVEVQLESEKSAKTQEALLNYSLQEIRYKQEVRKVLLDALLFRFAIMWHGYKGDFGMTEEKSIFVKNDQVFVQRLNPMQFVMDPTVPISRIEEARWVGRSFTIPLMDLLEDDTLDVDKKLIKGKIGFGNKVEADKDSMKINATDFVPTPLQPGGPVGQGDSTIIGGSAGVRSGHKLIDFVDGDFATSPGARFVVIHEIFMRPTKKERREGKPGKILLITEEQRKPLRVNDWPYKAEGFPAKVLQFNEVPDDHFGLSDIETYGSIADHKNLVINQQIRNAEQLNKTWVGISREGANEEDVEKAQNGENTIVTFESGDVRQRMFVASGGGGASQELYLLDGRIEKNLQDKSGVSDLKRGFLQSGEESATSVKLRAAGSSARPAYRQDLMADFLRESTTYINQLLKQFVPIKDAVRILGTRDIQWSNDFTKEEIQAEVDVEIDVFSMLPENPQEELRNLMTVLQLGVDALNNPNVTTKLQQEGTTFNLSPIIEEILNRLKLKDPEIFRGIRPEESQGVVSVAELQAARANIEALTQGAQQLPSPPAPGQDHRTRIETYNATAQLLQQAGAVEVVQALLAIIQQQAALLEEEESRTNPRTPSRLKRPSVQSIGAGTGTVTV